MAAVYHRVPEQLSTSKQRVQRARDNSADVTLPLCVDFLHAEHLLRAICSFLLTYISPISVNRGFLRPTRSP